MEVGRLVPSSLEDRIRVQKRGGEIEKEFTNKTLQWIFVEWVLKMQGSSSGEDEDEEAGYKVKKSMDPSCGTFASEVET